MSKGFKGFNLDMTCRGKQYTIGELAVHEGYIELTESGLHFCLELANVFVYYNSGIYCEVIVPDDASIITDADKSVTNRLTPLSLLDGEYRSLGNTYCFKRGLLHRDGGLPALIKANGSQYWYKEGKRHRDGDLPALIESDGIQLWYKDGKLHRDGDRPAIIEPYGRQYWYKEGNYLYRRNTRM